MSAAVCNQARSLLGRRCKLLHVRVVPFVILLLLGLGIVASATHSDSQVNVSEAIGQTTHLADAQSTHCVQM